MSIRSILDRLRNKKAKFKDLQDDDRMTNMVEQRKKSSDERELESRMEKIRQQNITKQLQRLREIDKVENRRMSILDGKNQFKGKATVMVDNPKLFGMKQTLGKGIFFKFT